MSRTGFALRTLAGPWLVVAALPLEVANFLQRGTPWRGEGMWTVEWFAIVLFVLGPLASGVAAVDAARLTRPGNVHLVVGSPRQWRPYVRAAVWCALPLVVVHLLTITAGLVFGAVTEPSVGWAALLAQAALQCLALTWYVSVGTAIGRFASPLVAGLAGSVLAFVLTYLLGDAGVSEHFALLSLGSATISRLGLAYHLSYLAWQGLLLALTAGLLALVPTRSLRGLRAPTAWGAALLAGACCAVVLGQALLPGQRLAPAPVSPEICLASSVRTCIFQEHRRFARSVRENVDLLVTAAHRHGYDSLVPTAVIESSRTYAAARPGVATITLPLDVSLGGHERINDWVYELTNPAHCPALISGPPDAYFHRLALLEVTWLSLVGVRSELYDLEDGLRVLTPGETAAVMADFRDCRLG